MMNTAQAEARPERTNHALRTQWPDLTKDQRAMELAKIALGWEAMDAAQRMENTRALLKKAQDYKETL